MDMLWYGLKVALVGMVVVFSGLVILIGCIKALKVVSREAAPAQEAERTPALVASPAVNQAAVQAPRTYVPGPLLTRKDDAFYAVVTAAIAAQLQAEGKNPEGGFAIRSIKTLSEPKPGPVLTPKDDAFYAVVSAAIAKTLESEGVNPDGGFAIRSVKAL